VTPPDAPELPPDILAIIKWLARKADGYKSIATGEPRLQSPEINGFKSDLMLRTHRWGRHRVPPATFSAVCIAAGLAADNTATLVEHLRNRQAGKQLRPNRFRKGWTYDGVVRAAGLPEDPDDSLGHADASRDW
jgi:hypothetical protein